jgi:hypothetical protein
MVNLTPRSDRGFSSLYVKVQKKLQYAAKTLFRAATAYIFNSGNRDYYYYGEDDRLPNAIIEAVNNSGTATSCVEKLTEFTYGLGFSDPAFAAWKPANVGQTSNQKLLDICTNFSYLQGYALLIFFTNEGKIYNWVPKGVQMFRRKNGGWIYNELMGEDWKHPDEDIEMKSFVPGMPLEIRQSRIAEQIKQYGEQVGEVYYPFRKRMGRLYNIYPVPDWYSDIESIIADGKVSEFDLRNIAQGWRASVIISTGPLNREVKDEAGKSEKDYFDESIEGFIGEDAAPVLHLEGRTGEEQPVVTTLPLQDVVDAAAAASERVPKRVCRVMNVPPVLVGFSEAGKLGDTQELQNIMKLFGMSVIKRQEFIKETLEALRPEFADTQFANTSFDITPLDVFGITEASTGGTLGAKADLTGKQRQNLDRVIRKIERGEYTVERGVLDLKDFAFTEESAIKYLQAAIKTTPNESPNN